MDTPASPSQMVSNFACPEALDTTDPPPVRVINPLAEAPVLITCEHGGNAVPAGLHNLGLEQADLDDHIGWDPGAASVAERLSENFNATAVIAQYSRLIVDPNRPLADPTSMPTQSDGRLIPANQSLSDEERRRRAALFYWPYHQRVEQELARLNRRGTVPALVSVHTFTPALKTGAARPWEIGVLYASDDRLAGRLMDGLKSKPDVTVGDNEPYSGVQFGYAFRVHAHAQGFPHVEVELRQDLLQTADGVDAWAGIIAEALDQAVGDPELHTVQFF